MSRRGGVSNDIFEISDNNPLLFFLRCCVLIPRLLELHLLGPNEVSVKEDPIWEGSQSSLCSKGYEMVSWCLKMEEKSEVGAHPSLLDTDALQVQCVVKEIGAYL
jgi:hypothetical protein